MSRECDEDAWIEVLAAYDFDDFIDDRIPVGSEAE